MTAASLPEGYGLLEHAHGFSLITLYDTVGLFFCRWEHRMIPPARGPRQLRGVLTYPTRARALQVLLAYAEEQTYLDHLEQQSIQLELFPERNSWYHEEIIHLLMRYEQHWFPPEIHFFRGGYEIELRVFVRIHKGQIFSVSRPTIDEAYPALYENVLQYFTRNSEVPLDDVSVQAPA